MRTLWHLLAALFLLLPVAIPAAEPAVGLRLFAGKSAAAPGAPVTLGLTFRLPAGWHTYWKNPGDSGLAPRVTWTLPAGSSISGPRWPTPRVFAGGGEVTYGYAGEMTLVFTYHVPQAAAPGARLRLAARVEWLLCRESCVPGEGSTSLDIAVARTAVPSVDTDALNRALDRLPYLSGPLTMTARESGKRVLLTLLDPERHGRGKPDYFFPENGELFTAPARQEWRPVPGGWAMELVKAVTWKKSPASFTGVLVFPPPAGGRGSAWELPVRWVQ